MSINHQLSSSTEGHHHQWWSPPEESCSSEWETPKERLFEKPLTPSDVGKLNRLVIPKQHAEKHFPLKAENGLLLGFEDEVGKAWRFRYSYWNSSQSYVLTKGWSRFVKDKRLDAGDIVMFARHRLDAARLFIAWRRRHDPPPIPAPNCNWGTTLYYNSISTSQPPHTSRSRSSSSLHAAAAAAGGGGGGRNQETTSSCGNSKTLRLFGVNLECGHASATDDSEPSTPLGSPTHLRPYYSTMDMSFSGGGGADVYRHRQG